MEIKDYVNTQCKICYLNIRVVPNSSVTSFVEAMYDGVLKIRLKSIPEKGKANEELIKYLSKEFNVKRSNITIVRGLTDKNKLVKIDL